MLLTIRLVWYEIGMSTLIPEQSLLHGLLRLSRVGKLRGRFSSARVALLAPSTSHSTSHVLHFDVYDIEQGC